MRIIQWTPFFYPDLGGIERLTAELLPILMERGHEFMVITSHGTHKSPDETTHRSIPIYRFYIRQAVQNHDLKQLLTIRQKIIHLKKTFQPDLIHIHPSDPSVYLHTSTASAFPAPTLVTIHNSTRYHQNHYNSETVMGKLVEQSARVTAVSRYCYDYIISQMPEIESKVSVIYNGIKNLTLDPTPLPFSPPHIMCIGRLVPIKGYHLAIKAMELLQNRFPQIHLTIIGDGPERPALEELIDELGLKNVTLKGIVPPDSIPSLINQATLIAIPSYGEGLSLVALEAAQMARPVIATRVDGLPEAIFDRETGLLVEPGDAAALAGAISTLLENPSVASLYGQNGRKRVANLFNLQHCADEYEALYFQIARETELNHSARIQK